MYLIPHVRTFISLLFRRKQIFITDTQLIVFSTGTSRDHCALMQWSLTCLHTCGGITFLQHIVSGHDPWSAETSAKCYVRGENITKREMPAIKKDFSFFLFWVKHLVLLLGRPAHYLVHSSTFTFVPAASTTTNKTYSERTSRHV